MRLISILLICFLFFGKSLSANDSTALQVLRDAKAFLRIGIKANHLTLLLESIHADEKHFWFRFALHNRSKLSWPLDLVKLYLRDARLPLRTSIQELELRPVHIDSFGKIPPKTIQRFLLALPRFTMPDHKRLLLELTEANGGRHITLSICNRLLFLVKAFPVSSKLMIP